MSHPLEPLTATEVQTVVALLKAQGKATATTRFVSVSLQEPSKEVVHAGMEGLPRTAFAVLFDNATNQCHEATVSITKKSMLSWKHVPNVQPTMTMDEQKECEQAVLNDPAFIAAIEKHHHITDPHLVMVDIWSKATTAKKPTKANAWPGLSAFCARIPPITATPGQSKEFALSSI